MATCVDNGRCHYFELTQPREHWFWWKLHVSPMQLMRLHFPKFMGTHLIPWAWPVHKHIEIKESPRRGLMQWLYSMGTRIYISALTWLAMMNELSFHFTFDRV